MSTGNVTIAGNSTGSPTGSRSFGPFTITATSAVDQTTVVALSVGANTITVPSGSTAAILAPPNAVSPAPNPAYGGTLTLKGITGDTGVVVSAKYPTMLAWDTPPATFVVAATAVGTLEVWFC